MNIKNIFIYKSIMMFASSMIWYLNKVISVCEYIKKNLETEYTYIINADINNTQLFKTPLRFKCTRKQRHMLYKKFKGQCSRFIIYSYGNEDKQTNKMISLKLKSYSY